MKIGYVLPNARYSRDEQIRILTEFGCEKIWIEGEDDDTRDGFIASLRPSSDACVAHGMCFGTDWQDFQIAIHELGRKGHTLTVVATDVIMDAACLAEAYQIQNDYRGINRMPSSAVASKRARMRKAPDKILEGHKHAVHRLWFDKAISTNKDAMLRISEVVGVTISEQTVRRMFGPSGRLRGNPKLRS